MNNKDSEMYIRGNEQNVFSESIKGRDHWEDTWVGRRIILIWILKRQEFVRWSHLASGGKKSNGLL
jgi:hypothetical protein